MRNTWKKTLAAGCAVAMLMTMHGMCVLANEIVEEELIIAEAEAPEVEVDSADSSDENVTELGEQILFEESSREPLVGTSVQNYQFNVRYGQTEARSMLAMINDFRTGSDAWYWNSDNTEKVVCSGLEELVYDYELEKVAMQRAAEIAISYSHTRPNGESSITTYKEQGYSITWAGENIAAGYNDAQSIFDVWLEEAKDYNDQGHRRNMLGRSWNRIGIGHVIYKDAHYWVQEFTIGSGDISPSLANDTETPVNISISDDRIEGITLSAEPAAITVNENESAALPDVDFSLSVKEHWGYKWKGDPEPIVDYTWAVNNTSIASVSDSSLTGISAGSTYLATMIYGRQLEVPITVNHVPVTDKAVAATCTKTGLTEGSHCSVCGTVIKKQQKVAKKAHTVVKDPAVPATCTKTGLTEGSHCSVCGKVITEQQTVEALGHDWKEWVVTKEATYESAGEKQHVCRRNSSHIEIQQIPILTKSGFLDVQDPSHPYYKAIYWAANAGITKGYSDGTFGINRSCTRGEMMMFLWKYAGKPEPKAASKSPFTDVSKTHAFYKAILWGYQNGITKGYSDGTFGINRNVSRGEAMMFLWKLKGKPAPTAVSKSPFKDVPTNHAFYKVILWGSQKGITKGYTSGPNKGNFGINDNCTRGQIVTFLYRANN